MGNVCRKWVVVVGGGLKKKQVCGATQKASEKKRVWEKRGVKSWLENGANGWLYWGVVTPKPCSLTSIFVVFHLVCVLLPLPLIMMINHCEHRDMNEKLCDGGSGWGEHKP